MDKVVFKSPLGELRWVNISPGGVDTSMNSGAPKFQKVANVVIDEDSPEGKAVKDQLQKIWEDMRVSEGIKQAQPKSLGIKQDKDKETKEPNGKLILCFKTNASYKDGTDIEIPIFDAKGTKISPFNKRIGNGSIGVIHGEAALYNFKGTYGITLYLKAIQLLQYVEPSIEVEAQDLTVLYPDAFGMPFEASDLVEQLTTNEKAPFEL